MDYITLFFITSTVIAISYWLEEHTRWIAHISGILLIIIISSILGNIGIVPSSVDKYSWQYSTIVPLGIILMLLAFNPSDVLKVKKEFIISFLIGAVATTIGGIIAGIIFHKLLPYDYWKVCGQLTASFIGGYENAVSVGVGLNTQNNVFLSVFAGDTILTSLWIAINILQGRNIPGEQISTRTNMKNDFSSSVDLTSLAITLSVALAVLTVSTYIHNYFSHFPLIMAASIIATLITFTPLKKRFSGAYILGSIILSYFIFGCGAISNMPSVFSNATILLLFPIIIVTVHAIILFGLGRILKIKREVVIITSQCLIGGPATALAVTNARKWNFQPEAITLGLLGYAIGNYLGFYVAWILK